MWYCKSSLKRKQHKWHIYVTTYFGLLGCEISLSLQAFPPPLHCLSVHIPNGKLL